LRVKTELIEILARHTNQPNEKIAVDTERDYFMTGEQAREYGIIDEVISKRDVAK
ncbi:MAG: ATP-dependent Clp protease proteolytic subunit, partial [Syntrophaceae bacterium]